MAALSIDEAPRSWTQHFGRRLHAMFTRLPEEVKVGRLPVSVTDVGWRGGLAYLD
jgi:hypothetical protein